MKDNAPMHFELAWDARCTTGESCVWDTRRGRIWFCDIPAGRLFGLSIPGGLQQSFALPAPVGSFGLCKDGRLLVALRDSLALFDPERARLQPFAQVPDMPAHARLNDGKTGPDGCFWVGTVDERAHKEDIGVLYRVRPDGVVERKAEGFKCSNGLAWSPDARTLFHSDSRGPWIDAWDFDAGSGRIDRRRRLATLSEEEGRPDGAACDMAGNYWSAGVSAGCLNCFSPQGALLRKIPMPIPAPTMPCFSDGHLYVTSLRRRAAMGGEVPAAGGLFRAPAPGRGVPVSLFEPAS